MGTTFLAATLAGTTLGWILLIGGSARPFAQTSAGGVASQRVAVSGVERNVIYGTFSGLALLMDVHRPDTANGFGVVAIVGTGFHAATTYDAPQMKDHAGQLAVFVQPLVKAGYTVFVINHRGAPRFRHPAAIEDAERAVRFVRHHAMRFGLSSTRIGAIGASSGGYLASWLGVRSEAGDADDTDAVNRVQARVQTVVAFCAPQDLTAAFPTYAATAIASYLGTVRPLGENTVDWRLYQAASPVQHVSPEDAPTLLIHGDNDQVVPFEQSEKMEAALQRVGVAVRLIRVPGAGHAFAARPDYPDFTSTMVAWLDTHLREKRTNVIKTDPPSAPVHLLERH